MSGKLTTAEFKIKAIAKHGDLYDYSLVEYVGTYKRVKIICKVHGVFEQAPTSHLGSHGCPGCKFDKTRNALRSNTQDCIKKFRAIHGDSYDYGLVEYTNNYSKVKITCKTHGVFEQAPANHLIGQGCPSCNSDKNGDALRSNTQDCIKKFKAIHGDLYDHSLVEYVGCEEKVKIICKTHGKFDQSPSNHLKGKGCPKCAACSHAGEKHHRWNFELTDKERELRRYLYAQEIQYWRKSVFNKDGFTCQKCLIKGGNLNAHHILPWSKFPEVRFDVDNGIALCNLCHHRYHRLYRLAECNHKTIAEFLSLDLIETA